MAKIDRLEKVVKDDYFAYLNDGRRVRVVKFCSTGYFICITENDGGDGNDGCFKPTLKAAKSYIEETY